jgi:adenosylcobinamide-GDP ribazoletransferase
MSTQWRLFLTALRFFTRVPLSRMAAAEESHPAAAARFAPVVGVLVGAVGAGVYWLAAQVWPTSVGVILSMLATVLITGGIHERGFSREPAPGAETAVPRAVSVGALGMLFAFLIKYNALMALSAANLAFPLPAFLALGVIMISGHAASRALAVSAIASHAQASSRMSNGDVALALGLGFAPATLLGIPGLMGLSAAIVARIAFAAYVKRRFNSTSVDSLDATQQITEICFYLGALATWAYI